MTHAMHKIRISLQTNRKKLLTGIAAVLCLAGLLLSAGCVQSSIPDSPTPAATRPVPSLPGALNRVEPTVMAPVSGEVPGSLLEEITHDLSERLNIEIEKIEVIKAEAVVWNDGSLGCPQPGLFYTQALVNGYWLILEVDSIAYDYRASDRGYFTLCERPSLPALATPSR